MSAGEQDRPPGGGAADLIGDDISGEGYLAKAGRLTATRHRAERIIRHEDDQLSPEDDVDEDDEPTAAGEGRWS